MRVKSVLIGLGVALACAACASGGASPGAAAGASDSAPQRNPNLITAEELIGEPSGSVYDAIQHLRPQMLVARPASGSSGGGGGGGGGRSRGGGASSSAPSGPNAYLDSKRLGDATALKNVALNTVKEIRFFIPADAAERFGPGNEGGVIQVISR